MNTGSKLVSRVVLVALGVIGASSAALADPPSWARAHGRHDRDYRNYEDSDYARVVDVDPIVRRVRVSSPQRDCWQEDRAGYSGPSHTEVRATIIGGLIGAAVGHRIGMQIHDPAAIVGGSLIGAAIGNNIGAERAARRGDYREDVRPVQRCEVSYRDEWEERIDGYRVTYVYHGREYTTQMPYDPGKQVRINVDVTPDYRDDRDD